MTTTETATQRIALYADALVPGDLIVGDRTYPSGSLDLRVKDVTKARFGNVTVQVLFGPHQIEGTITYAKDDSVTVIPGDPFAKHIGDER